MKKRWIFLVISLSALVAINSILPLLDNKDRTEWLETEIYQIILIVGWSAFFLTTFLCGLVLKKSRYQRHYSNYRKAVLLSMLITIPIVLFGIINYNIELNRWEKDSYARSVMEDKAEVIKFMSTIDSLKQIIIATDSSSAEPFFQLGLTYRYNGNWNESVANYRSAIALDKTNSTYFSELGYSESYLGQYEEAIQAYEKAYQLDSSRAWILDEIKRCSNLNMRQD